MSTLGHKRKRSLQDSPVDLTTMQVARKRLLALQEELSGIQETELEMEEIMKHVDALAVILGTGKKLKLSFSSVQRSDLTNIGLIRKPLRLNSPSLDDRKYSHITDKHVDDLCIQITRIRRTASKRFEAGARMILDAVLLAIADISLDVGDKLPVAIFPEMRIAPSEGVLVKNPKAQFEVWLSGNVDYGVCTYEQETDRATVLQASLEDLMMYAKNRITLVEAKREQEMLADNMPEATSQAIALSEVTGNRTIRYCLSNGRQWMFAIYNRDDLGNRVSYEGAALTLLEPRPEIQQEFQKDVRRLLEVLWHWLITDSDAKGDSFCTLGDKKTTEIKAPT